MPELSIFTKVLYIISMLFIPIFIWMIYTSIKVNTTFNKYSKCLSQKNVPAHVAARRILDKNGLTDVNIDRCQGKLTDHYDPRNNTVYLSDATYDSSSIAAIGVASHEVGHALQYANEYKPVKVRTALVPAVNFTAKISFPLLLLSIVFELIAYGTKLMAISNLFLILAICCYAVYTLFTLITLPTEYNASKRAKMQLVECEILDATEVKQVSKVLSAAAATYLASFALSLVQLARLLMILFSRRRR